MLFSFHTRNIVSYKTKWDFGGGNGSGRGSKRRSVVPMDHQMLSRGKEQKEGHNKKKEIVERWIH